MEKRKKECEKGHVFWKSSDCPSCPVCEKEREVDQEFLRVLSAPARRALESEGIATLLQLSQCKASDLLNLHGFGPSSVPKLKKVLSEHNMAFRED
ncbi:hypothetical protein LAG90_06305 [Marinilongibacter aquaticus]|uniref:DNA-directed RNA polymerase subunit alpha C-terminal domain-containing protein n=1 Tax=Marinilongibacter aquaticus TaxID=2975157 RepID=UPI0021BD5524|nr:DNA-directed RNA polymerase subunit alpha C-terminal domain-containing protein [Marinilongibacter aquaticus]UBM60253.1 hypothetical protein LAG90_06305 [Marinilongibacter aquaticus]